MLKKERCKSCLNTQKNAERMKKQKEYMSKEKARAASILAENGFDNWMIGKIFHMHGSSIVKLIDKYREKQCLKYLKNIE